jgi:DNA-3-methyladenine glycosylase
MALKVFEFLNDRAEVVAPALIGCLLVRTINANKLVARIVETEAYDQTDLASHSYRGITECTAVMFGPAGHLYVYFTYGMHYCCNVVVGPPGHGAAVLIRAVEPVDGEGYMAQNRHGQSGVQLTNGPAKLCQALSIDKALNGHNLQSKPLELIPRPALPITDIIQTTRIGISQAADTPWRYYERGNQYVSRP